MRHALGLLLLAGCTQDFDAFEPGDAADVDATTDSPAPVDAAADVPSASDAAVEAAPDVVVADAGDGGVACTETGSIVYAGHCYFPVATAANEATARTTCTNAGAHLVTITTAGEQAAVIALGSGTERWIGLFRNNGAAVDASYAWITGEGRNGFSAWSPGEPNGSGQCARLLATGLWADQDCTLPYASICERE